MLKEVNIVNYQGHRNTNIKLSSGITGIIGTSLNGKTAIIRAIKWVVENRPGGLHFRSDFAKEEDDTSTQLAFDDCKIKLSKTKNNSIYTIEEDGKISQFKKFGNNIPDTIKNKMNLDSINFQNQLDAHFLITSSGGKIAKAISSITQADKLLLWIQKITKELSTLKNVKFLLREDLEEIDKKLAAFKELKRVDRLISKIEEFQNKKEKVDCKYYKVKDLLMQIKEIRNEIKTQEKYLKIKPLLFQIERLERQLGAFKQQKELLLTTQQKVKDIDIRNKVKKEYVKKYIHLIRKNKMCPTCFGTITNETIERIEKEMVI